MPINYNLIKRECALRTAQLEGTSQATLEANYTGSWSTALDGAEIPISSFKVNILAVEKELAHVIGSDAQHPYRSMLYGRSDNLANLASTPTVDDQGFEFVGVFDSVTDSTNFTPCTVQPTQTIADEQNSFFDGVELYNFNITGNRIRHTRESVFLEGCVWDYDTQAALYESNGDSPLPQMLANTWIAGYLATTVQVGWVDGANAAQTYNSLYQQGLQILKMRGDGMINLPLASQNVVAG